MGSSMIIRDAITGQIRGSAKEQPVWASEVNLKNTLLMPAIRQMTAVQRFYRDGRTCREISAEVGLSINSIHMLLMRARRGLGAERLGHDEPLFIQPKKVVEKHDEFSSRRGFGKRREHWNSKGSRYTMHVDEARLIDFFVRPALQRYRIAELFWLRGLTANEVARVTGINLRSVEFQLGRIRKLMTGKQQRQFVSRGVTRTGKRRTGVTATYQRRQS